MRFPIRSQLMAPLLAVAVASLAAVAVISATLTTSQTTRRVEHQLRGVLRVLAASSYPLTDGVLKQMAGLAGAEFILADDAGAPLATSNQALTLPADVPTAPTVDEIDQLALGHVSVTPDGRYLHTSVRVARRPGLDEPRVLHTLFPRDDYNAAWRAAFLPPLAVGVVMVLAIASVVLIVAGRVGGALSELGEGVQRLAEGDYSEVALPKWDDETRDLALAIRRTAHRLEEYEANLRRTERLRTVSMLGAGLAHELRNSATGCRLAVDLHTESCTSSHQDDSLDVAKRQLAAMEARLQQMLDLGKEIEVLVDGPGRLGGRRHRGGRVVPTHGATSQNRAQVATAQRAADRCRRRRLAVPSRDQSVAQCCGGGDARRGRQRPRTSRRSYVVFRRSKGRADHIRHGRRPRRVIVEGAV